MFWHAVHIRVSMYLRWNSIWILFSQAIFQLFGCVYDSARLDSTVYLFFDYNEQAQNEQWAQNEHEIDKRMEIGGNIWIYFGWHCQYEIWIKDTADTVNLKKRMTQAKWKQELKKKTLKNTSNRDNNKIKTTVQNPIKWQFVVKFVNYNR